MKQDSGFLHPSVCLSVCLSVCPSVRLSVCLFYLNGDVFVILFLSISLRQSDSSNFLIVFQ